MIELRQYQISLINKIDHELYKGNTKILITSAPASGKTTIYGRLITVLESKDTLIVVPSSELKEQVRMELERMGITEFRVDTIQKLLNEGLKEVDILILDEGHRYQSTIWSQITQLVQSQYVFGLTATPFRTDHRPLLKENGGFFECNVEGPTIAELTSMGYAADIIYYTTPIKQYTYHKTIKSTITGLPIIDVRRTTIEVQDLSDDVVNQYKVNFNGIPAIAFCRTIRHTKAVAEDFRDAGVPAEAINGDLSNRECNEILAHFKIGDIKVVTSCRKINEGLNAPNCKVALFLREFHSLINYIQSVGRVIRVNGNIAHVVDLCGNFYRFGRVDEAEMEGKLITV